MMTTRTLCTCLLLATLASAAGAQSTQFHLASAQVVAGAGGVPMLRLAADGPVAHAVEPDASGTPAAPGVLRLRLYGVAATAGLMQQPVAPFVVQTTAAGPDTILTVTASGLGAGQRLAVGQALRASELVIVVR